MRALRGLIALLPLSAAAAQGMAGMEMPKVACAAPVMVPGFPDWAHPAAAAPAIGQAASLPLLDATKTIFTPALARSAPAGSFGGTFALHVAAAGTYRIALSAPAWIDVVIGQHRLESTTHMHGPDCSGITKIVTFQLPAGDYVIQLSEAKVRRITLAVAAA